MYKTTDYIYIVSNHTGAIPYLRQNGPIVTPLKVTVATARKCLIGGFRISQYDPKTKQICALNLQNLMNDKKFDNESNSAPVKVQQESKKVDVAQAPSVEVGRGGGINLYTPSVELKDDEPVEESDETPVSTEEIKHENNQTQPSAPNQQHNGKKNKKNR